MGNIITSYDTLVSAVIEAMEDDGAEFSSYIPTAIGLAESRLEKQIDTDGMIVVTTVVATAGNYIIPKPSGYKFMRDLEVVVSGNIIGMKKKVNSFLRDYWPNPTATSTPAFYADYDKSNFMIAPTPVSTVNLLLTSGIRPTKLSAGNQTNYFTDELPDALFYATMGNMAEFMKNWSTLQVWDNKYLDAIKGLNNEGRRARKDDDTPVEQGSVANNTLMGDK